MSEIFPRRLVGYRAKLSGFLASAIVLTGCSFATEPARSADPVVVTEDTPACRQYSKKVYGADPNRLKHTGGGSQLVTVVAPESSSDRAKLAAWDKADGCWQPASLMAGHTALQATVGRRGLTPYPDRRAGSEQTPTGLFPFMTTMYGLAEETPNPSYKYHTLECGDWWDELPGSPTYDSFQQLPCGQTPPFSQSTEALWKHTSAYQHFIPIDMPNLADDPESGDNGAGIFLHDTTQAGYTSGCVSLQPAELDDVLAWLRPKAKPHIMIDAKS